MSEKEQNKYSIGNIMTNVILILAVTLFALAVVTAVKNREDPTKSYLLGFKPIYVETGSMEPYMMTGSVAIVHKTTIDDIEVGDVVAFYKDEKLITHRVMSIEDGYIKTKGDNNEIYDNFTVAEDEIQAEVILRLNWIANLTSEIKTPKGVLKWIGFPIFVIAVIVIAVKIIRKIKNSDDTLEPTNVDSEPEREDTPSEQQEGENKSGQSK